MMAWGFQFLSSSDLHRADIALGIVVVCLLFWGWKIISSEKKIRTLGGHSQKIPSYLPFGLDVVFNIVLNSLRLENLSTWEQWFRSNNRDSATLEVTLLTQRTIFTADPENIKAILATQFHEYGKGKTFHEAWKPFLGDSIFSTDGELWHASRQLLRPLFLKDRVSDFEVLEAHTQQLLKVLLSNKPIESSHPYDVTKSITSREVDIGTYFFRYTLDVATDFLLGQGIGSLENPNSRFEQAFEEVQRVQSIIARTGPLSAFVSKRSYQEGIATMNQFLEPFIESSLALTEAELMEKSESGYTFLHALASFTKDPKVIRDQLVAILIAGRDTTASALSWVFFELSRHPDVLEKLRREITHTLGSEQLPSYDELKNMKYLQSVIKEVLRLYPIIPYNMRFALKDTTLPRGGGSDGTAPMAVLKDTPVFYSPLFLQRSSVNYPSGTRPSEFNPSRWDDWSPKAWTYIPFNGGSRICIGQQFALTEISYVTVRLLQTFEGIENCMERNGGMKSDIVLRPAEGVRVRLSQKF